MTERSITCPQCGLTSYNPNDIRERYCGRCHQWHEQMGVEVWVIYSRPKDMPDAAFVLRRQMAIEDKVMPSPEFETADSIEAIRALVPPGKVLLPRHPDDDPVIVETWI